jgi:hypothetical protein
MAAHREIQRACLLSLVVLLWSGCKREPVTCEAKRFLRPSGDRRGISLQQLEPDSVEVEVSADRIQAHPTHLTFTSTDRVTVHWLSYGHVWSMMELTYSAAESKVRIIRPEKNTGDEYPLVKQVEGRDQWVRLGFMSPLCSEWESALDCSKHSDARFLVAEMLCSR